MLLDCSILKRQHGSNAASGATSCCPRLRLARSDLVLSLPWHWMQQARHRTGNWQDDSLDHECREQVLQIIEALDDWPYPGALGLGGQ